MAGESSAWSLLRAANAPVAVAVLGEHLADPQREVPASELVEAVEADLDELRSHGFSLPQAALQYCKSWLDAGFLIRRPSQTRDELYSLSDGALAAIRFVQELSAPRSTVTESRLTTIVDRIRQLSIDTDPDVTRRIEALRAERYRIDQQISRLAVGEVQVLESDRAAEQVGDILSLVSELPEDFARLRADLEEINGQLRRRLIEEPQSRGSVLDEIFRGVDMLQSSPAGRSFTAFYALILDPERTVSLDEDIDALLERPFARSLSVEQRAQLRRLLPVMQDSSSEIHQVMTSLSRSLRRFVQSEELAEERQVHQLLREATGKAHVLFEQGLRPFREIGYELGLTRVPVGSVAAVKLHDPEDSAVVEKVTQTAPPPVDVEELRASVRESEIDSAELIDNVNAVLADHGPSTLGEVLASRPATQGVASVIGLVVLAEEHAAPVPGRSEQVRWTPAGPDSGSGEETASEERQASLPVYLFKEPIG
ncbi:hypothetical protein GCM10011401_22770 [Nesterenkonia cremea]|uniref:DUF3375 domain-containing protein n=2 Tax=Nesterenkonia cremea TaxID=1882340 RepID=A0A917AW34_9MICC|nr:hypothetical protein GCM10011401_22770 [Nesterenkonia cremea]